MIIKNPLSTEKAIRMMESENKLVFEVDRKSSKGEIKKELESIYKIKIQQIRTMITSGGKKRAYVRFADEFPAIDLATKLGLM